MGLEFIRRAAKPFKKRWDEGRKELGTADLFTREPSCAARSAPFEIEKKAALRVGDTVTVEAQGMALVARLHLEEVARTENPPPALLRAVQGSCGIAKGIIEQVHIVARVAEISLC